jgi:(1->4)-alpha-D-glucan 1-alpha-D-glucosylmutase
VLLVGELTGWNAPVGGGGPDFVPNHMGVGRSDNLLWLDVLEWGRDSGHAGWFDIDWEPDGHHLLNKLLVPFLGDQYGVELKGGKLKLKYDGAEGMLAIWAYDIHKLPICPLFHDRVLAHDSPVLDRMSDLFSDLPMWRPQVAERARELKSELASLVRDNESSRVTLNAQIAELNNNWQALDALIQRQNWRVAYYGAAGFAGLRMELPVVFRHAHACIIPMIEDGTLEGIRSTISTACLIRSAISKICLAPVRDRSTW